MLVIEKVALPTYVSGRRTTSASSPSTAKAVAGIGSLPATAASRSIPIRLQRRAPNERVEDFFEDEIEEEAAELRAALAAFGREHAEALAAGRPDFPLGICDRAAEIARPLLAIADLAGGEWPERARAALHELLTEAEAEDEDVAIRLLADLRYLMVDEGHTRIKTAALLELLHNIDDSPWGDWYGKPLSAHGLSKLLRPFRVKTMSVKVDGLTVRGYKREQFEDLWLRYLHPTDVGVTGVISVTSRSTTEAAGNAGNAANACDGGEAKAAPMDPIQEQLEEYRAKVARDVREAIEPEDDRTAAELLERIGKFWHPGRPMPNPGGTDFIAFVDDLVRSGDLTEEEWRRLLRMHEGAQEEVAP
jgi:Protein of unknown function (DUF3631)